MTDLSEAKKLAEYRATNKVRFVTAASLFDGHDASINIMRRILQSMGCEVIHLGHNRSVQEVVSCALQEDAQGIAVSSYQGGHVEYFKYMIDLLRANQGGHIKVFGGGGGVIVPAEIRELHEYGVARIYSPEDGQRLGLQGMIGDMIQRCDRDLSEFAPTSLDSIVGCASSRSASGQAGTIDLGGRDLFGNTRALSQLLTVLENGRVAQGLLAELRQRADVLQVPTLGITGTGGAGKSSLTDELVRRFRLDHRDSLSLAIISVDPTRRKSGGALLGDRIRMNAIGHPRIYMRSLATRDAGSEISQALPDVIAACKLAGFDLIIVETSGIGQGDAAIVPLVDCSLYVMTPEFGAASQLEKIDMLDFADFVAINKFDRKGSQDALRDVSKQYQRNRELWSTPADRMPVFGTQASRFNDDGVTALYQAMLPKLVDLGLSLPGITKSSDLVSEDLRTIPGGVLPRVSVRFSSNQVQIVPPSKVRYLAEISETVRTYKQKARAQAKLAREVQQLRAANRMLGEHNRRNPGGADLSAAHSKPEAMRVRRRSFLHY